MTEDKAGKALRKVIINLIPEEKHGHPVKDEDMLKVDISDKLEKGKIYYFDGIDAEYRTFGSSLRYIPREDHNNFKAAVENILDATIVNSKQRESIQKLLDAAFYARPKFDAGI